ncbi:MAG: adenylate/guanylate cyclase domain-containing protein [Leptospiraceae bacterium]|nr:adenylate/guanylate cyclase domain-containing protein [Leptospiraceae bacterium]
MGTENTFDSVSSLLDQEIRAAFEKGTFYAALIGLLCGAVILALSLGGMPGMLVPCLWSFSGGLYSVLVYFLIRSSFQIPNWQYYLYLPFVSFPTVIFLLSELLLPAGSATYFNGPPLLMYFVLVALSGMLFDRGLSIVSGAWAMLQYLGCWYLARPELHFITAPDPVMEQDLRADPIYLFKAVMLLAMGFIIGVSADTARRLIEKVLREQKERAVVDRLFGEYVSPEVKDKVLRHQQAMIAERKQVVVLFSDIRGFTSWSENCEPETLVKQLNAYFEEMVACITVQGGLVDKFIGDAIMAVFGGLRELEKPAEAAFQAAIEMHSRLDTLNQNWHNQGQKTLQMGVGLHFGSVLEGNIGSRGRKEFTVIGDTVNTAARLETATKEMAVQVLVSAAVETQLSPASKSLLTELGSIQVKGKSDALLVYGWSGATR